MTTDEGAATAARRSRATRPSAPSAGRPLLLGEAPSKAGDRYYMFPLSGNPAERLIEWAGLTRTDGAAYWDLIEHFDTMNAIERYADAYPWTVAKSRHRWTRYLLNEREPGPLVVVALGTRAADAVGIRSDREWGDWLVAGLLCAAKIPHPSGQNRLYNRVEMKELAGQTLRQALYYARGGPDLWPS